MSVIYFLNQLLLLFFEVKNVIVFTCLLKYATLTDVINVLHKLRQMSCECCWAVFDLDYVETLLWVKINFIFTLGW